ncbi:SMODS domain-containing nucleotidyltransferase [Aureimonas jatrophae]|uniref:SMODS domain-containing nucleotidyltransferase n=1 Tax=Aureimonas jatrophae TaxID=1166073 RepID=UPI0011144418|nr:nucleotidyltransferase [Aureimonas jatrophae]
MQLSDEFARFLADDVNLNKTRIGTLETRVETIERFIESSTWTPKIREFSRQGSWAHKTIIKPPGNRGFDADLLVMVEPEPGWSAADYVEKLYEPFRASGTYREMVSRKTRCVVVTYAGDFSLDVVPCVVGRQTYFGKEICNRYEDAYEGTDGKGYAEWWDGRCRYASDDSLREAVRLLKYLRDIKGTFSAKSVLLTTMVGERVNAFDSVLGTLPDAVTTLKVVVGRLDDHLKQNPTMPDVRNPAWPEESFTRHWDADKYANFRAKIATYRSWIDDAFDEPDRNESIRKWRRVFGEAFAAQTLMEEARAIRGTMATRAAVPVVGDAVALVRAAGREVLSRIPATLPWVKKIPWHMAPTLTVNVRADVYNARVGGRRLGPLQSGEIVSKGRELLLSAVNNLGNPFPTDYDVRWRVVNTDEEAARQVSNLRGGFYKSEAGHGQRWEATLYRGPHWVEALLIRRRDKVCVGRSERFFVVVE